jgi:hypothetical protein
MLNLPQKFKKIKIGKSLATGIFFAVLVFAGFGFAGTASAAYYSSGNWTSTNLVSGETVSSIDSFIYNLSAKPANTDATIQFSQDSTNWYDSTKTLDASDTLTTGTNNTIDLSGLGWSGANFYYKITFTSSDGVNTPVLDDISVVFTSNQPPNTPTNSTPTNGATGQDLNVTLTGSAYSDPDTDPQTDAEWQVDDDSDFSSPVWTRTAGVAETGTTINASNGTFANELAGKTELDHNTVYYWQVRYQDSSGSWSDYSTSTSFTTNLLHTPVNSSPADQSTVTTLSPLLEASVFSDDQTGHTHAASQWQVDDNSDFSSPAYDSGETASGEISHAVPAGSLSNFSTYYWRVRYKDSEGQWSDYSTATQFSIQISATAVDVRPILSGDSFKPGETVPIEVQLLNFSDGSPLNNASATLDIYDPSGTKVVDGAAMTYQTGSNGVYKYSYTAPTTNGSYRYEVSATMGDNSGYGSANFYVSPPYVVDVSPLGFNVEIKGGDSINLDVQVINTVDDAVINDASVTITIRDPSGAVLVSSAAMTYVSGSNGIYRYTYTTPTMTGTYSFEVTAVKSGITGYASSNFYISPTAATVSDIESNLAAHETAQAASRAEVTEILKEVEAGILEAPKTAKSGNTITIKYRAQSGLTGAGAPKLNVYDASDTQRVTDGTMTEIGTTGVYSASFTLQPDWGTGFFTVLVSESTNNTSDHTQIFVGSYDIEEIGSDLAAHETAQATSRSTIDTISSNVDVLIGAMIVTQSTVNDASPTATSFGTSLTNSTDDFYKNAVLTFTSGALDGQCL